MPDSFKSGTVISKRYEIEKTLGGGGMGIVYKALDISLQRPVALKMIRPDYVGHPDFARRFATEAQAAAKLNHPNILRIYDFQQNHDSFFMVTPLINGESLKARLSRLRKNSDLIAFDEIVRISIDVCDGLDHAHSHNVIHRDIKPDNLMLQDEGPTIITDFGIAKILGAQTQTATGGIIGTPEYMPPEQAKGQKIDARSDIYSLGIVMFEMATGRRPFEAETPLAVLLLHVNERLPKVKEFNPSVPDILVEVIERALAKDPEQRFQSAKEMADFLFAAKEDNVETEIVTILRDDEETLVVTDSVPVETTGDMTTAVTALASLSRPRTVHYDYETQESKLRRLVDEFIEPFHQNTIQSILGGDFIRLLRRKLAEAQSSLDKDFTVTVIGDFNRGKSTLINALLKSTVVTTDILPETITINQLCYGEKMRVEAHLPDGGRINVAPDELKAERLSKLLDRLPAKPSHLSINIPNQLLRGIQIVDTPGLGDSLGSSDPAVLTYLQHSDAVVYVISALSPLSSSERAFLQFSLRPYEFSKICFVVNYLDSLPTRAEAQQVLDSIKSKLWSIFPNAQVFGLSALAEYHRALGQASPNPAMEPELQLDFKFFRDHLRDAVLSNRQIIHLERAITRIEHVLLSSIEDINKLQLALAANRAEVEAAIAQCEDENSELRRKIQAHKEQVFQRIVDLGTETVSWMEGFIDRLRHEVIITLSQYKYDDIQRFFSFFLADSLRSALLQCLDFHQTNIVGCLEVDANIILSIGNGIDEGEGVQAVRQLGSQFSFEPTGRSFLDNVQMLWGSFGGLLGTILLGLIDKKISSAEKISHYQKKLLQSLPALKLSMATEIQRCYMEYATLVSQQLDAAYQHQLESALTTLRQAYELSRLETKDFVTANHSLQEIISHTERSWDNLSAFHSWLNRLDCLDLST